METLDLHIFKEGQALLRIGITNLNGKKSFTNTKSRNWFKKFLLFFI
jgi:hypothetical protein